jgi:hypothetical protein
VSGLDWSESGCETETSGEDLFTAAPGRLFKYTCTLDAFPFVVDPIDGCCGDRSGCVLFSFEADLDASLFPKIFDVLGFGERGDSGGGRALMGEWMWL